MCTKLDSDEPACGGKCYVRRGRVQLIAVHSRQVGGMGKTAHERQPAAGVKFKVVKPLMVHPYWDAALLEVKLEDAVQAPEPLKPCATAPDAAGFAHPHPVLIAHPYSSAGHD